jgi:uncharacterized membrane protein
MPTSRLEAFSDGVMAIIITIMVLELKAPAEGASGALQQVWPRLLHYLLSFVYVGIYWNNHHHMFHAAGKVSGVVLWANLHLLFWLSLFPFVTDWMGKTKLGPIPTAAYGTVLLLAAIAYQVLQWTIVRTEGKDALLAQAVGSDSKGKVSILLYAIAIGMSFVLPWVSVALYIAVALIWLVPDRRIEEKVEEKIESEPDAATGAERRHRGLRQRP